MCITALLPERLRLRLHISRLLVTFVLRDSMAEWRQTDVDRMVGLQWQMQPNQERLREVLMIEARIAAHRSRTQVSNRVALAFDAIHARHLQELPSLEVPPAEPPEFGSSLDSRCWVWQLRPCRMNV